MNSSYETRIGEGWFGEANCSLGEEWRGWRWAHILRASETALSRMNCCLCRVCQRVRVVVEERARTAMGVRNLLLFV